MHIIDCKNELTPFSLLNPISTDVSGNGTGVDVSGYHGVLAITQHVGIVTGTTPTLDGKIQDSADNSTFADVSGATFTQVTASGSFQTIAVNTQSVRKYIRYARTAGGTTPNFTVGVIAVGQKSVI